MSEKASHPLIEQLHNLGVWEQRVFEHLVRRKHVARNINQVFEEQLTVGQRVADVVAAFGGSWPFMPNARLTCCSTK